MRLVEQLRISHDQAAASRDLLETTLRSIGDAVIATDAEGRVRFLNPVAQNLTGWTQQSAADVPLHRVFRIVNETTRESVEDPVEKVIRTGRIVGLANHTILISRDGHEIPIDNSAAPIRGSGQELIGTVLVFRDVTERRRAELELRKGHSELERSNSALLRMNADLELFSSAAAHDLQEPLRTISNFSELVIRKLSDNPEALERLRFVQQAAIRMRALIDGLLDYSRLMQAGHLELQEVRMDEVVGEILLNCASAIEEAKAIIHVNPLWVIRANYKQMVHLLQNLIVNAIKYRSEKVPEIHIRCDQSKSGDWLFSVRDNGVGFEMDYAETVFQAFRRLHSAEQVAGTGLGLAMCRRIVELHGGQIWVESEPNCGSIFRFTIARRNGAENTSANEC